MNPQSYFPAAVMATTALLALWVAQSAWRRRAAPGGVYFILLMTAVAVYAFADAAELAALTIPTKIMWSKISYLGIVSIPPLWLLFAISYSRHSHWLTRRRVAALWLLPLLILGLAVTNEWHGLIWPTITAVAPTPGARLIYSHGIGIWVHAAYAYTLLLVGTFWLVRTAWHSPQLYRQQVAALVVGAFVPWLGNLLYLFNLNPWPGLDLTPLALTLTGLLFAWSLFRFQMLDLAPIARDVLFERMGDGVIVLDVRQRIIDLNPMARHWIGVGDEAIGQNVFAVVRLDKDALQPEDLAEAPAQLIIGEGQAGRVYDLTISPLRDGRGSLQGWVVLMRDMTAYHQVEAALREKSEEVQRERDFALQVMNTIGQGLTITNAEGHFEFVNPAYARLLGYSPEALLGHKPREFTHPDDVQTLEQAHARRLAGQTSTDETRLIRADGQEVHVLLTGVPRAGADVQPYAGAITVITDLTERRRIEVALEREQNLLRTVIDNIPDQVFARDRENRFILSNLSDARAMGLDTPETLRGKTDYDVYPAELAARYQADNEAVMRSGEPLLNREEPTEDAAGRRRWMLTTKVPLRSAAGEIIGVVGIARDITERKQAEAALRESEERYRRLVNLAPEAIYVHRGGVFLYANPAGLRLLAAPEPAALLGTSLLERVHPAFREVVRARVQAALERGRAAPAIEEQLIRLDGSLVDAEVTATSLTYQGQPAVLVIARDITERKQAEEALRESEAHYRLLAQNATDLIWTTDLNLRLTYISPSVIRLLGFSVEEALARTMPEAFTPASVALAERVLAEAMALERAGQNHPGASRRLELELYRKDGATVPVEANFSFLREATGQPVGLLAIVRDITDRKRTENYVTGLNALKQQLLAPQDLRERLKLIAETVVELFGADFARVWIVGEGDFCDTGCRHAMTEGLEVCRDRTRCLHLLASAGRYTHLDGGHRRVPLGAYKIGRIASGEEPKFISNDVANDPQISHPAWARSLGLVAFAGYRLTSADGHPTGVLALFWQRAITPDEERFLEDLANSTSQVILTGLAEAALHESEQRYRVLYATAQRQAQAMALQDRVRRAVAQELDLAVVIRKVVEGIAETFGYPLVSLYLRRGECLVLQHEVGYTVVLHEIPLSNGIIGRVTRTGQPVLLEDVHTDPAFLETAADITSEVCVPLFEGEVVVGGLNIESQRGVKLTEGDMQFMVALSQHISIALGRARLYTQLRESEERYRTLAENAQDSIFIIDRDFRLTYVNRYGAAFLGSSPEAVVGQSVDQLFSPATSERQHHSLAQAFETGETAYADTLVAIPGHESWLSTRLIPLYDPAGQVRAVFGIARDITAQKTAQAALARSNVELEQRVEARTAELRQANEALRRALRIKDEFLAAMSHELRTPLTAMMGMAELLQMQAYGPLTEKQAYYAQTIYQSGQHLLALINDVLDLTKIAAGQLKLEVGPVSVAEICQETQHLITPEASKKQITVSLALDPAVTGLRGDPRRLQQILVNLLGNAVKFTPAGGRVGLAVSGDENQRVVNFTVWDTGIGIAAEDLPRLFQDFVQLDARLARNYEGTGLGLALVRRLAELHGGQVRADSDGLGKGSRFTVSLPWVSEMAADAAESSK